MQAYAQRVQSPGSCREAFRGDHAVAHGTLMYMPPELLLHGTVSCAANVYHGVFEKRKEKERKRKEKKRKEKKRKEKKRKEKKRKEKKRKEKKRKEKKRKEKKRKEKKRKEKTRLDYAFRRQFVRSQVLGCPAQSVFCEWSEPVPVFLYSCTCCACSNHIVVHGGPMLDNYGASSRGATA